MKAPWSPLLDCARAERVLLLADTESRSAAVSEGPAAGIGRLSRSSSMAAAGPSDTAALRHVRAELPLRLALRTQPRSEPRIRLRRKASGSFPLASSAPRRRPASSSRNSWRTTARPSGTKMGTIRIGSSFSTAPRAGEPGWVVPDRYLDQLDQVAVSGCRPYAQRFPRRFRVGKEPD